MVAEPSQYSSDFGHSFKMKINEISLYFNGLRFHLSILPKSNYLPLCCLTGLAFVDVSQLTADHLVKDAQGKLWIRKPRQKTKEMCNIPLLSAAKEILDKYESYAASNEQHLLLPVLSNQKANAYLKEIADICHVKKRLTTHVARHTAATVVFLANDVSMENVAKILGHANLNMTRHYAKVLDQSIMRDMEKVERRLA